MRIDLDRRLTLSFAFAWGGLIGEFVGSLFGRPVDDGFAGVLAGIILGTFGIGAVIGSRKEGEGDGED